MRGWVDETTGKPFIRTLRTLGLEDVISNFEIRGRFSGFDRNIFYFPLFTNALV